MITTERVNDKCYCCPFKGEVTLLRCHGKDGFNLVIRFCDNCLKELRGKIMSKERYQEVFENYCCGTCYYYDENPQDDSDGYCKCNPPVMGRGNPVVIAERKPCRFYTTENLFRENLLTDVKKNDTLRAIFHTLQEISAK